MKEIQFVASRGADWNLWDRWLGLSEAAPRAPRSWRERWHSVWRDPRGRGETQAIAAAELATRFRGLCHDLSLARDRNYSSVLVDRLQMRVLLAHQRLYGARQGTGKMAREFLLYGFALAVRREYRVVTVAALLFFVPIVALLIGLQIAPQAVYLFLEPGSVAEIERTFGQDSSYLQQFVGGTKDWVRYAGYVANNVRIDFQCFATGIVFCVGTVFYLLFNGLNIGAAAGYLTQIGLGENFWGFVSGHSPFELTGVVLSGAAGLKLGMAVVAPGQRTRRAALLENTRRAAPLIFGAALLTFLAASIEAFWSPLRSIPIGVKYGVGIALWVLLLSYFGLAGRSMARPPPH
jgi:uncharacterized membrane protein SpoIIM required for sporulation